MIGTRFVSPIRLDERYLSLMERVPCMVDGWGVSRLEGQDDMFRWYQWYPKENKCIAGSWWQHHLYVHMQNIISLLDAWCDFALTLFWLLTLLTNPTRILFNMHSQNRNWWILFNKITYYIRILWIPQNTILLIVEENTNIEYHNRQEYRYSYSNTEYYSELNIGFVYVHRVKETTKKAPRRLTQVERTRFLHMWPSEVIRRLMSTIPTLLSLGTP